MLIGVRTQPVLREMGGARAACQLCPRINPAFTARGLPGRCLRRERTHGAGAGRGRRCHRPRSAGSCPGAADPINGVNPRGAPPGERPLGAASGQAAGKAGHGWESPAPLQGVLAARSLSLCPSQPRVPSSAVTQPGHQPVRPLCVSPALCQDGPGEMEASDASDHTRAS